MVPDLATLDPVVSACGNVREAGVLTLGATSPVAEATWAAADGKEGTLILEATPLTNCGPDCNTGGGEFEPDSSLLAGSPGASVSIGCVLTDWVAGKEALVVEGSDAEGTVIDADGSGPISLVGRDGKDGMAWLKTGGAVLGPSVIGPCFSSENACCRLIDDAE